MASQQGHFKIAELLLKSGADVGVRDAKGMTALLLACQNEQAQEKLVQILLDSGADPKATDPQGNTALMLAARAGAFQVIEVLAAGGVDVSAKDKAGWTALRHAQESKEVWTKQEWAPERRAEVIKRLKQAGATEN